MIDDELLKDPMTWEAAAQQAAESLSRIDLMDDPLTEIEYWLEAGRDKGVAQFHFMGSAALDGLLELKDKPQRTREELLEFICTTIAAKQHDYGTHNILWGGVPGLVLRMHDKTSRLRNLQGRPEPQHESVFDSWLDLVGYSIIGIMLDRGTFTLPLLADYS